jgi:hypothetical protein
MNISRCVRTAVWAGAATALLAAPAATVATAVAAAQPRPPCAFVGCPGPGGPGGFGGPGRSYGPPPRDLGWRGIDDGRRDHRPFDYNGAWVTPVFDPGYRAWGFWFLGAWIPL